MTACAAARRFARRRRATHAGRALPRGCDNKCGIAPPESATIAAHKS
jgi:hypothetical protein